ncbi:MAG: fibronectin type III domain-containing protein [Micromonosporaceae bacterium]
MRRTPGMFLATGILVGGLLPSSAAAAADAPQLVRFHGGGYDQASAVTVDAARNVYVAGAVDGASGAGLAVVKLSPTGAVQWVARYNGSAGGVGGRGFAVAVGDDGNVYAAGWTSDGAIFGANIDALVVGFGSDGTQRWAHRIDGPAQGYDVASEVAVDPAGDVYVGGFTYGQNNGQAYDWLVRKYRASGELAWSRTHSAPGTTDDRVADMALSPSGTLVVTGFAKRADELTNDLDTVAYRPDGGVAWQRSFTDTALSHELPQDLDVDAAGRIAITGIVQETASPYAVPNPVTLRYDAAGTLLQTIRDGGDAVDLNPSGDLVTAGFLVDIDGNRSGAVSRYSAAGARLWSTPLSVAAEDVLTGLHIAADSTGAVTLAATIRDVFVHNDDYATIRYAAGGTELWRHRFNGPVGGDDVVAGLAVDAADEAIVVGTSWNNYLSSRGTADDIVLLRFAAGAAPALLAPSGLTATGISASQVRLTWQDNAGTEDSFAIERCLGVGCTSFAEVARVGHDVTTYTDSGLARNTQYTYRVRACVASACSPYSGTATGKTRKR